VKPISFIVGQSLGKDLPYPMKCLQVKGRLFRNVGLQVEPVFVVTYGGTFGFGVSGVTGSEDSEGDFEILEVKQGLTFDVNLGLGFAL
jgi:hypothetical protein